MKLTRMTSAILTIFLCISVLMPVFAISSSTPAPEITAKSAIIIDLATGTTLYEKDIHGKIYPASMTKMLTLALLLEKIGDMDEEITISKEIENSLPIGSANAALKEGEIISVRNLIYCIATKSANEACNALAVHVSGSIDNFVEEMNTKAKELGANDTHFVNVHGLHDPDHYTTVYDLTLIAKYAMNVPLYMELSNIVSISIPPTNKTKTTRNYVNTNYLINRNQPKYYYKYASGMKTGFTDEAGYCLTSTAEQKDMKLLSVVVNSSYDKDNIYSFLDAKKLYEWAFSSFVSKKIASKNEPITEVKVELSAATDHATLVADQDIYAVLPVGFDVSSIRRVPQTDKELLAPIAKGEALGYASFFAGDEQIGSTRLVALNSVSRSTILYYGYKVGLFFKNTIVRIVVAIIIVLIIIYAIYAVIYNRRSKFRSVKRRMRF